jgi:hypothetical protein
MEGTLIEEVLLKREIEDLPVVSSLSFIRVIGRDKADYRLNLFCNEVSSYGGCTDGVCTVNRVGPVRMSTKRPTQSDCLRVLVPPVHMSTKRPTQSDCLRVLGEQIRQDHGSDCVVTV